MMIRDHKPADALRFNYVAYNSIGFFYWPAPLRMWTFGLALRLRFGYEESVGVRSWCFGPITVAVCDLEEVMGKR